MEVCTRLTVSAISGWRLQMIWTQYHRYNIVFQHSVARHLCVSMESDSLPRGLDYKMFTRKTLSLHEEWRLL
jgi:hypothetical protein